MKFLQPPLQINCAGLSKKLIKNLADRLRDCFERVEIWSDEISAGKPRSEWHYNNAWNTIDSFGVKVR